ncbi:MAG TPA: cytochrome c peroxidase [Accumulibacter sp.]|uniref:cytochrome-c peroxidase n=1 Tax=Accumulibacter sp. TaxID=2053492 RepID=UPI002879A6E2|nr:cytochrome c peroxidase [Accumulibacter sp.]MDS4055144.1 cytochrome c peroxidase [Accumulibacter sp.]HMV04794.1 cytochrome c peroxidase [Accumulibacter sp.]HMX67850.1 cytochrome c peroxidase [Accumulibacter sp.]HNC26728.1 cytochrome c peroxidase [Accumulibacter sp.]HNE40894.1 cytochrome c peroxidase [Accumulibacter sp.]
MIATTKRAALLCSVLGALLIGCVSLPQEDVSYPRSSALPPPPDPPDNPTTPAKAALGKQLFFDKRLSGDGSTSCEGCHYRHLGWTDGLALSRKVGGEMNTRHTPTLYNTGYADAWYWDGRARTLEGQIAAAWKAQIGADPQRTAALIGTVAAYRNQFQAVFGSEPTADNIPRALAAFLRTLSSGESPWDRYVAGDSTAVPAAAIAGHELFIGKAGCASCHTPPLFTDNRFHNIGLEAGKSRPDSGRQTISKDAQDLHAFKTPTLRSVGLSGPYFHDGSVGRLEDAVRYMAAGGGADPQRSPLLVDRKLSEEEIAQIVAFLGTLTSDERFIRPSLP